MYIGDSMGIINFKIRNTDNLDKKIKLEKNINIIIEDNNNLLKDEDKIIMNAAKELFDLKQVESVEEGIIVAATMFRGLKYKKTEELDNNINIIFLDQASKQK